MANKIVILALTIEMIIINGKNPENMKRFGFVILTILVSVSFAFCQNSQEDQKDRKTKSPQITFEKTEHHFGDLPYKGDGTCEFVFKNTGKEPLILTNVKSSCGCTVPTWTKEPVKKGKTGTIKVKYDTKRQGKIHKYITVQSNAENGPVKLLIKGNVAQPSPEEMEKQRIERQKQAEKRRQMQQQQQSKKQTTPVRKKSMLENK